MERDLARVEHKMFKLFEADVLFLFAMKRVWGGRSVNLGVKKELYERIVVPTVMFGSESWV